MFHCLSADQRSSSSMTGRIVTTVTTPRVVCVRPARRSRENRSALSLCESGHSEHSEGSPARWDRPRRLHLSYQLVDIVNQRGTDHGARNSEQDCQRGKAIDPEAKFMALRLQKWIIAHASAGPVCLVNDPCFDNGHPHQSEHSTSICGALTPPPIVTGMRDDLRPCCQPWKGPTR